MNPSSLRDISTHYCSGKVSTICDESRVLRCALPRELCERLILSKPKDQIDDDFAAIFSCPETSRIESLDLSRCSTLTDLGFQHFCQHKPKELDINKCVSLTESSLDTINEFGSRLEYLKIGSTTMLLPVSLHCLNEEQDHSIEESPYHQRGHIIKAPNLRCLIINDLNVYEGQSYFTVLLRPLEKLSVLDLSGCCMLGNLKYANHLKYLASLVLFNVPGLQDCISAICQLTSLRHLDLSQHVDKQGIFRNPHKILRRLSESLPELVSLEISGTNLAVCPSVDQLFEGRIRDEEMNILLAQTDIPALVNRVEKPLEFLGLHKTKNDACLFRKIPANKVTGSANEMQVLNAVEAYVERPNFLRVVLSDLFNVLRYENYKQRDRAVGAVVNGMKRNVDDHTIQISGSASLFYIVKSEESRPMSFAVKQQIIDAILTAMEHHKLDSTLMRNGCLTLCQFKVPEDILPEYKRIVKILLNVVADDDSREAFVQRISIYLLNSLACQVDVYQKEIIGDLGCINSMIKLIQDRLDRETCDEIMEIAWSTMWNVTDETPKNCRRFLEGNGMEIFYDCTQSFATCADLMRNMMGLMGNVAEVKELRPMFMVPDYITCCSDLLNSDTTASDGIEVSYNAAGVLAHIMSDGPEAWTMDMPTRQDVLDNMVRAIKRWDINTKRNINYRSFEPILRLLFVEHTFEVQMWAVWALANLTKVYPEKYYILLKEEKGLDILDSLLAKRETNAQVRKLALMIVTRYVRLYSNDCTIMDWDNGESSD